MSNFLIPHLFANDTAISAADVDACFQYVRDYINGAPATGGIDASNLSASTKFLGSQIAQDRAVSVATVIMNGQGVYTNGAPTEWAGTVGVQRYMMRRLFLPTNPVEIVGVRVNFVFPPALIGVSTPYPQISFSVAVIPQSSQLLLNPSPVGFFQSATTNTAILAAIQMAGGFILTYDTTNQGSWGDFRPPTPGRQFNVGGGACYVIVLGPQNCPNDIPMDFFSVSLKLAAPMVAL